MADTVVLVRHSSCAAHEFTINSVHDMGTGTMKLPQEDQPQITGLKAHPLGILREYTLAEGHPARHADSSL